MTEVGFTGVGSYECWVAGVGIRELGFIFCNEYGAENDCEVGSNE
jgi:hypothetical protein